MRPSFLRTCVVVLLVSFAVSTVWAEPLVVRPAVKTVNLVGYTRAVRSMTVTSEVAGRARRVNYDVGDTVGAQKPLIEVDTVFIDHAVLSAEARVVQLEVSAERAESRALYLENEFNRMDSLHKEDRATGIRRDAAHQEMVQARLAVDSVGAELARARASLAELSERRERHRITVPAGWIVTARLVEPGEIIQPGGPLARAADFRRLIVPLAVSKAELDALKHNKGDIPVRIEGREAKARINWINPAFDEQTRKIHIELALIGYKGERRGGLKATVPLSVQAVQAEGMLVPRAALISRYGNPRVRLASTGESIQVIVISINGDDIVISSHDERLSPGVVLSPAADSLSGGSETVQ